MAIEVKALTNGPLEVSGDIGSLTVTDKDGNACELPKMPKVYLCRCGGSANKPFCDGQHKKIGFEAD